MATFKVFQDWICPRQVGPDKVRIEPVFKDGYQMFGYVYACSMEGACTMAALKAAYQRNGLKNTAKRDAAIRTLVSSKLIMDQRAGVINNVTALKAYIKHTYNRETSVTDWDEYFEALKALGRNVDEGLITTLNPLDNVQSLNKQRRGFKRISDMLIFKQGITKHAGKKLQVYIYLAVAAAYKPRVVPMWEEHLKGFKVKLYKGEALVGGGTIGNLLGMSPITIRRCIEELKEDKLISIRLPAKGNTRIIKVLEFADKYKPKRKTPKTP